MGRPLPPLHWESVEPGAGTGFRDTLPQKRVIESICNPDLGGFAPPSPRGRPSQRRRWTGLRCRPSPTTARTTTAARRTATVAAAAALRRRPPPPPQPPPGTRHQAPPPFTHHAPQAPAPAPAPRARPRPRQLQQQQQQLLLLLLLLLLRQLLRH